MFLRLCLNEADSVSFASCTFTYFVLGKSPENLIGPLILVAEFISTGFFNEVYKMKYLPVSPARIFHFRK
jgi:hypothetical protein